MLDGRRKNSGRQGIASGVLALGRRFLAAPVPVLPGYRVERNPLRHASKKALITGFIAFVGLIYGFLVALFPYWMYLYLITPLAILALIVIWTLPRTDRVPERGIEGLYWVFLISLLAWPNYLAIAIPGLPWITVQRLFLGPLVFLLLISLSMSPAFRERIAAPLGESRWLNRFMLGFIAVQVLTLFFAKDFGNTFSRFFSNQLGWTGMFYVSILLLQKEGRIDKFFRYIVWLMVFACAIGAWEWYLKHPPWAGHIPSFLAVQDERVQELLNGERARKYTTKYRVAGTFVTSLNLAEFIGLGTAIVIHLMMKTPLVRHKALLAAFLPGILLVIVSTDSRLGSIAFFGCCLLYPLLFALRRWYNTRRDILAPGIVLLYPMVTGAFVALSFVWRRLEVMMWGGNQQQSSTDARKEQWALLWPKLEKWPFGHGAGNSGETLGWYTLDGKLSIDSYYIATLLDYGVIGFILFYGMLIIGAYTAVRLAVLGRSATSADAIVPAIILPLFIVVKGVFAQENEHAVFFMLLGLVAVLKYLEVRVLSTRNAETTDRRAPDSALLPAFR